MSNLGLLLLGFLKRFGRTFDYDLQAVSIAQGGIIAKEDVRNHAVRNTLRLCVEDANTGRQVQITGWQV